MIIGPGNPLLPKIVNNMSKTVILEIFYSDKFREKINGEGTIITYDYETAGYKLSNGICL